jgi:hypothetical protein
MTAVYNKLDIERERGTCQITLLKNRPEHRFKWSIRIQTPIMLAAIPCHSLVEVDEELKKLGYPLLATW